ncbi:MAG: polyribonucleotide nucleotidyltransferase, partial [Planctomycetia bacterium]|nr:polyribonucleotide nucleotidyltransferase [Planctomycetia bacterium]
MQACRVELSLGAQQLSIETGRWAKQAHGAAVVQYGDTVTLVTAVEGEADDRRDFFPLVVDYREKTYAAGKFPGGFIKREGRPTTKEILTSRLIDRPIRPLFPAGYFREVQVMASTLSADRENDPDILSMIGASAALHISHIPFLKPTAAIRVGRINNELVVMPTHTQMEESELDLIVSGTRDAITMIEGFAREMAEEHMLEAILFGHQYIVKIIQLIEELREKAGLGRKEAPAEAPANAALEVVRQKYYEEFKTRKLTAGKHARADKIKELRETVFKELVPETGDGPHTPEQVSAAFAALEERVVRDLILNESRRIDGRGLKDLREIKCEVSVLPRTHGTAVFQRGETQALVTTTLGTVSDEQRVDGIGEEYSKKFMLDYNFPPFSVGECRPIRGPGRREIGHGALAERSLKAIIPNPQKFPYTIRVVSDILESNGSSSMASVCGGTLSMMDAGVPITNPVAGISIGLVKDGERFALLTDIMGDEDHFGDMDFKVAGTQNGVTGIQLDLKIDGINEAIIRATLEQAKDARREILRQMLGTIRAPRGGISAYAPRLLTIKINPEKIGLLIGPGGKTIKGIQEATGAKIDIEDDGTVYISHSESAAAEAARMRVEALTEEVRIGKVYEGKVTSVKEFGAFIEIMPGRDGLCHISELDDKYVGRVEDVCKVGDRLQVKVIAIDDQDRVKLSRRALLREQNPQGSAAPGGPGAGPGPGGPGGGPGGPPQRRPEGERRPEGDRP